jgi:orotidine-5'-phosphate decarboxylase
MSDDRLIAALDVPNALQGMKLAEEIGDAVSFYKIGLGMLTGGGLALANELKQEHGKRIFLDMKLFDIGATIEAAVRGLAQFDLDANLIKPGDVQDIVLQRAANAFEAGADGVIASPHEAALIRTLPNAKDRLIVTPGVRPTGSAKGDQKRVATPAAAITDGADHIVVGRPIWTAENPRAAAQAILADLP